MEILSSFVSPVYKQWMWNPFFPSREEMEILNIIIAAITAATFNSVAHSAPVHNTPSTLELLVTAVIPSRVTNATLEVFCVKDFFPIVISSQFW